MTIQYKEIAKKLKEYILTHPSAFSYKLPTEKQLCIQYSCSRQTIRMALSELESEGLIRKLQGSGSFVNPTSDPSRRPKIAIIIPSDTEYLYPALLSDLQHAINKFNYAHATYLTENSSQKEHFILTALLSENIAGIIVITEKSNLPTPSKPLYEKLRAKNIPIVFLPYCYSNLSGMLTVSINDNQAGFDAARYLLNKKHKKIASFLAIDDKAGIERYLGISKACLEKDNITYLSLWYDSQQMNYLQKKQDTGFIRNNLNNLDSCSAIICQNDELAYWLIKELINSDYQVPDDISILSFDCSYLSDLSKVPITSFSKHYNEYAEESVLLLMDAIHSKQHVDQMFYWTIVEKKSSL